MAKKKIEIKNNVIRVFEGFAGYGGASFGLKRLKERMPEIDYEVVGYSEIDKFASELFPFNNNEYEKECNDDGPGHRIIADQLRLEERSG